MTDAEPHHPTPTDRLAPTHASTTRPHAPRLLVGLDAVNARYRALLTAPGDGFRTALVRSVADVPALVSEVERLYVLLLEGRRRYADLAAAARATLAAHTDGEPDPLAYLRDELSHVRSPGHGQGAR
jgi:hypothetical protein